MHARILLSVFLCCLLTPAQAAKPLKISQEQADTMTFVEAINQRDPDSVLSDVAPSKKDDLARIERYLNRITTFVADFVQINPDGTSSNGTFFLSRPGQFRWQYDPPVPILIVANGTKISHFDYELNQLSHTTTEDALAVLLTRVPLHLSGDIQVTHFAQAAGIWRLTLVQRAKPKEGKLTLIFNSQPIELKKLEVTDANNHTTTVTFSAIRTGVELSPKLFTITEPSTFKRRQ